ncbi:MAG: regulatory protein LuxR [Nocardioidaceae bacterium]|nr:regulatory protein LuxR [Nocardioidaceae bacterium]
MTSLPEPSPAPAGPDRNHVFHVSIGDDGTVEVDGGTPQEIVDLLREHGNPVTITGDLHEDARREIELAVELDQLSERERDILALIATGFANAEIATEMYISINTIKSYIRSAYRKMNVTSRSQAVIWAIDHGVVSAHATRERDRPA